MAAPSALCVGRNLPYGSLWAVLPGMLYGKILYSEHAHARIKSINTEKARKLPGVRAVITGYDIPDVRVGFLDDQSVLKRDVVRQYRGEVAAVAAVTPQIAEEALRLIEVEYEPHLKFIAKGEMGDDLRHVYLNGESHFTFSEGLSRKLSEGDTVLVEAYMDPLAGG